MTSAEYRANDRGPRTDPCGTPQRRLCKVDRAPENAMSGILSVRNEVSHCSTWPPMPYDTWRRRSRIWWSTVSNAALRPYPRGPATSPAGCQQRRWCHRWLSVAPFLLSDLGVGCLNRWHKVTLSEVSSHLFSHDSLDNLRHKRQVGDRSVALQFIRVQTWFLHGRRDNGSLLAHGKNSFSERYIAHGAVVCLWTPTGC